jgi:kinetochore protein NDC80
VVGRTVQGEFLKCHGYQSLTVVSQAQDRWQDPGTVSDPLLSLARDLPSDYPNLEERFQWDYIKQCYNIWFDGTSEDFTEPKQELAEAYGKSPKAQKVLS